MGDYSISAIKGAESRLPTPHGEFRIAAYRDIQSGKEHAAIFMGNLAGADVLVRVHSECLTGDIFQSLRCDCGEQLQTALQLIAKEGRGAVLYLRQEGRGIGLIDKIAAYELQETGMDTVDANRELGHPDDARTYDAARDMLKDLGITSIQLLTNNPAKVTGLEEFGINITRCVPLQTEPNSENAAYLQAKKDRMGHKL
jgi:3,4-dihydroxy 2-butanone 4-phosphate synthase/GTP cyclohydrolase II